MIFSVLQCVLELISFALKSIGILLLFDVVLVNVTLGFYIATFLHNIWGQDLEGKKIPAII